MISETKVVCVTTNVGKEHGGSQLNDSANIMISPNTDTYLTGKLS